MTCRECRHSDTHLATKPVVRQWLVCHNSKSDSFQQEAKVKCEKFEKVKQ